MFWHGGKCLPPLQLIGCVRVCSYTHERMLFMCLFGVTWDYSLMFSRNIWKKIRLPHVLKHFSSCQICMANKNKWNKIVNSDCLPQGGHFLPQISSAELCETAWLSPINRPYFTGLKTPYLLAPKFVSTLFVVRTLNWNDPMLFVWLIEAERVTVGLLRQ